MLIAMFRLILAIWVITFLIARPEAALADTSTARCKEIEHTDFSSIPDALTQIIETRSAGSGAGEPAYCEVHGYVAPSIGFMIRIPSDHWNGKLLEFGCGGTCGSVSHIDWCDDSLRRGYACIVSDGGHTSSMEDMKWSHNNPEAVTDYLVRASHLTILAGKSIVEHFYNQKPMRSYFFGFSGGGAQAMFEAQRFPWDFDGVIAVSPSQSLSEIAINIVWANRALTGNDGRPLMTEANLELLHHAVVTKCDMNDGIKDGVIGDPRECHFDPSELRCTRKNGSQCLTEQQIGAIEKIYGGPVSSTGVQIAQPIALRGSEPTWNAYFEGSSEHPNAQYEYVREWFSYYLFQPNLGPTWVPESFDFDLDYKRLDMAEISEPAVNPDLRRFKAAGGKLLVFSGWSDAIHGVLRTVDYYETVERVIGGRAATQDFFRLFVVPGMGHGMGGDGPMIDYLTYLEAWVERNDAPDKVIGVHVSGQLQFPMKFPLDPNIVGFSRPIYPYPTRTKYLGHGDAKDSSNFGPFE
jgi:Tannase and feruloyl esterase